MGTATEWEEEEEIAGEFDGGCRLETKRRREHSVSKDTTEMEDEVSTAGAREESGSIYFDEEEGTEFFSSDGAEKKLENGNSEIYRLEHLQIIPVEEENQDPNMVKLGNQLNSHNSVENGESITVTQPETQTQGNIGIAQIAKHVADLALEKVLEEQETHDLFCPNCHSCITKRVILRKRKRKGQGVQHEEHPEKLPQVEPNTVVCSAADIQETSYDNESDIFKCLSCFSFFIPTENGFNIFRIFRKREESVSVHDPNEQQPGQASARDGNWFSSIFKAEPNRNKENEAVAATKLPVEFNVSSGGDQLLIEIKGTPALSTSEAAKVGESHATNGKINSETTQFPVELKVSSGGDQLPIEIKGTPSLSTVEAAKVGESRAISGMINSATKLPVEFNVSSGGDQLLIEIKGTPSLSTVEAAKVGESRAISGMINSATKLPVEFNVSSGGDQLLIEIKGTPALSTSEAAKVGESHATNGKINSVELKVSSGGDQLPIEIKGTPSLSTVEAAKVGESHAISGMINSEVDFIIPIVTVEPSSSKQSSQEDPTICVLAPPTTVLLPQGDVQIHLGNQISLEPRRGNEWEVVKSIVYGGLIESITSLGVVSSAAGAQTLTLNVVALGLANLAGGFFVILHDLSELKSNASPNQKDEQDSRYWKLLGRKSNFSLHATVSLVSYIFFGLLPPIIYGFTFRESDDKGDKLIAVAAASLLCIALLAVGKVYVSEPKSYIKTFVYYIGLGFTASGLSYVAGMLINRSLEQLGLFEHNALVPPPPSLELFGVNSALASWASE